MKQNILLKKIFGVAVIAISFYASPSFATDWFVDSTISRLEGSYVPMSVQFMLTTAAGNCPAGTWIVFDPTITYSNMSSADQESSIKAIYALAMTAVATGKKISVGGFNTGCKAQYVHLLNQ